MSQHYTLAAETANITLGSLHRGTARTSVGEISPYAQHLHFILDLGPPSTEKISTSSMFRSSVEGHPAGLGLEHLPCKQRVRDQDLLNLQKRLPLEDPASTLPLSTRELVERQRQDLSRGSQ